MQASMVRMRTFVKSEVLSVAMAVSTVEDFAGLNPIFAEAANSNVAVVLDVALDSSQIIGVAADIAREFSIKMRVETISTSISLKDITI